MVFPRHPLLSANQLTARPPTDDGPPGTDGLAWGPPEPATGSSPLTLQAFSAALKDAGIVDNRAINLYGATVWLPYGMRLRDLFERRVAQTYERFGFEPFAYPSVVPDSVFDPLDGLFGLKDKVLRVGVDSEVAGGRHRATLSPTGEATIYFHWATYVREAGLPLRIYRNATYFRPVGHQAGMGIFNGMEATGVFEFHAAYADEGGVDGEVATHLRMLDEVFTSFHIPRIWSLRPRWTNIAAVSARTVAADTLLPTGTSLQIGAVYDQQQIYSRRYNIRVPGADRFAFQVAGFCSRRLLLAQLMISTAVHGRFFVHPAFSPVQVAIVFQQKTAAVDEVARLEAALRASLPHRVAFDTRTIAKDAGRLVKQYASRGVPLVVLVQDRREPTDDFRVVLRRSDTGQEAKFGMIEPAAVAPAVSRALAAVAADADRRVSERFYAKTDPPPLQSFDEVIAATRDVRVFPLAVEEGPVRRVEAAIKGEIIGFVSAGQDAPCVVTGQPVATLAVVCRRF